MRFSYRLFRVFGIDVRVHVTFVFIVAYFAVVWGALRKPGGGWMDIGGGGGGSDGGIAAIRKAEKSLLDRFAPLRPTFRVFVY